MNADKLRECFTRSLNIPPERVTDELAYNTLKEWDSVGHMVLVAEIEGAFDVRRIENPHDIDIAHHERFEIAPLGRRPHRVALHPFVGLLAGHTLLGKLEEDGA